MTSAINPLHQAKPTLVVGLGLTGFSVANYLLTRGEDVVVMDSRAEPPLLKEMNKRYPDVAVLTGTVPSQSEHRLSEHYGQVIASPGIALDPSIDAIGDIELFAQNVDAPVIAITGSNGKSTVTMLVTKMLQAADLVVKTGGNIGVPALDLLTGSPPDFYVLELSSFQLELTHSLKCVSAGVLNVSEDHMDRYASFEDYVDAKLRIYQNAQTLVVNRDEGLFKSGVPRVDPVLAAKCQTETLSQQTLGFGLGPPHASQPFGLIKRDGILGFAMWLDGATNWLASTDEMTMRGQQNISNVLAAMALLQGAGVELTKGVIDCALAYPGLAHRCEIVKTMNGVSWINDSKGTNVGATVAAINGLAGRGVLIAGGVGKGADFSALRSSIQEKISHLVLFGQDANDIARAVDGVVPTHFAKTLKDAVAQAATFSNDGAFVLFSPACSSFDMFDSFEHRGDQFRSLVLEVGGE